MLTSCRCTFLCTSIDGLGIVRSFHSCQTFYVIATFIFSDSFGSRCKHYYYLSLEHTKLTMSEARFDLKKTILRESVYSIDYLEVAVSYLHFYFSLHPYRQPLYLRQFPRLAQCQYLLHFHFHGCRRRTSSISASVHSYQDS